MAKIKVTGGGWVEEIDYSVALKIKEMKKSNTLPSTFIDLGRWSGTLGEVRQIDMVPEVKGAKDNTEYITAVNRDFVDKRKKFLGLPLAEKANNLDMFGLLYWASTGEKEYGTDTKEKAIKIQNIFFSENPKRAICDPLLFKELLPDEKREINRWQRHGHSMIERAVQEDYYFV